MARQRFIWPQLWDDPDLGELDDSARLLYIGCFSLADDEGRILGDPVYLKSAIFKYRSISATKVLKLRNELERVCRHFVVYRVRQIEYIAFQNWSDFQKPKYPSPSRIPPPPERRPRSKNASKPAPLRENDSGNDSGSRSGSRSRNDSGSSRNDSPTGWVGLGSTKELNPRPLRGPTTPPHDETNGPGKEIEEEPDYDELERLIALERLQHKLAHERSRQ